MTINRQNEQTTAITDDAILEWLVTKVDQLHDEANALVDDYWRRFKRERKKFALSEQGRIGLRIRRRETSLSFSIEWFRMTTLRQNGQNKPIAQYLKKGSGYRYPLGTLLKNEPDWERLLVEEMETDFEDIRKQMALLGKIRDAVKNYRKATQQPVRESSL